MLVGVCSVVNRAAGGLYLWLVPGLLQTDFEILRLVAQKGVVAEVWWLRYVYCDAMVLRQLAYSLTATTTPSISHPLDIVFVFYFSCCPTIQRLKRVVIV